MALSIYVPGAPQPTDGWLVSEWDQGFSPTEWQADNVFQAGNGDVTILQLDPPEGGVGDYAGAEVQHTAVAEATGTWVWEAKAPKMVPGAVFAMFLFQGNHEDPRLEFDFEIVGDDPTTIELVTHMAMANGQIRTVLRKVKLDFDPAAGFNRYEVSLDGTSATFKINGSVVATFDGEDFGGYWRSGDVRSYINLWATNAAAWAGTIDPDTLPIKAEVRSAGWSPDCVQADFWRGTSVAESHRGTALGDVLDGLGGADRLYGESGNDRIYGEAGNDRLYGWTGSDRIYGGAHDDSLYGEAGDDFLYGGAGSDRLVGGSGADRLVGGLGGDIYVLSAAGDTIVEALDAGIDTVQAAYSVTLGLNVENLLLTGTLALNGTGNGLANRLTGNSAENSLRGRDGNDRLQGRGGQDLLLGQDGQDTLFGGTGQDILTGGAGNDVFVFASRAEAGDIVADFRGLLGDNDQFHIDATAFGGGLVAGQALSASQFRIADSNVLKGEADAMIRFVFEADSTRLWFDANGSGAGGLVLVADLQAGSSVTAADIWLI